MDDFFDRLTFRAATFDELLSNDFEPLPSQKSDTGLATRRLAAWCNSSASGDWSLFVRRLARDGLTIEQVLSRFSSIRRKETASTPIWVDDAKWIESALRSSDNCSAPPHTPSHIEPVAFGDLYAPLLDKAETMLWSDTPTRVSSHFTDSSRTCLRRLLLESLSDLATPALYERFSKARLINKPTPDISPQSQKPSCSRYHEFVAGMRNAGFRSLFEEKPVLLRLIATVTRQWIDTSRELILRLDADMSAICRTFYNSHGDKRVANVEGGIADLHNGGHSVQVITFEDGSNIVYKPKDLQLDAHWYDLIKKLNHVAPSIELKTPRVIARDGYGWAEFIPHSSCAHHADFKAFFERAGAWLALFHIFAATDMHQENILAAASHPVPIDLETMFQALPEKSATEDAQRSALDAATEIIANSVMTVGLLPTYGRDPNNKLFAMGGLTSNWNYKITTQWMDINTDEMRPVKTQQSGAPNPNLPHVDGQYAKFGHYIDDFIFGFDTYANFLRRYRGGIKEDNLFQGFNGLKVRKVIRLTRFYYLLLMRLKDHRSMDDGVVWSVQADFIARFAEWDNDFDPQWPLQKAERSALLTMNVPYFFATTDGTTISDVAGASIHTRATSGIDLARARLHHLDEPEIAWQIQVIESNTASTRRSVAHTARDRIDDSAQSPPLFGGLTEGLVLAEADRIAHELAQYAIRRGSSAAWIGLDWLGDAETSRLICLGPDLYNGASGIGVFLAAHTAVTGRNASAELALAAIAQLRRSLKGRNAARQARTMGVGGAIGLGSVVYALTVMSKLLDDRELLADAHIAAELFTDDLIAADKRLDVIGGSAGAILGLLRLYRDSHSIGVLRRAAKCGEHLLAQRKIGLAGRQSWVGQGFGPQPLNGMSHGAAGFAYALASLSEATRREEFARAAMECIAFEDSSYDPERHNWPDLRGGEEPTWPSQWCHGAPGIGLARIATMKVTVEPSPLLTTDIENAIDGVKRAWHGGVDTLCCGALGNIEFLQEAGRALGRRDLCDFASKQLFSVLQTAASGGDYRWNNGQRRFNLGLFRGLSGIGYTLLRQHSVSLPNVLIWQ